MTGLLWLLSEVCYFFRFQNLIHMLSLFLLKIISIGSAQCIGMKAALCSLPWLELTLSFLSQDGDPPTLDLIYMQVCFTIHCLE